MKMKIEKLENYDDEKRDRLRNKIFRYHEKHNYCFDADVFETSTSDFSDIIIKYDDEKIDAIHIKWLKKQIN